VPSLDSRALRPQREAHHFACGPSAILGADGDRYGQSCERGWLYERTKDLPRFSPECRPASGKSRAVTVVRSKGDLNLPSANDRHDREGVCLTVVYIWLKSFYPTNILGSFLTKNPTLPTGNMWIQCVTALGSPTVDNLDHAQQSPSSFFALSACAWPPSSLPRADGSVSRHHQGASDLGHRER
jgi:hypothetical protein